MRSYRKEVLYAQFRPHGEVALANDESSDQEAKILFAAMIGARLLAQSVGDAADPFAEERREG